MLYIIVKECFINIIFIKNLSLKKSTKEFETNLFSNKLNKIFKEKKLFVENVLKIFKLE